MVDPRSDFQTFAEFRDQILIPVWRCQIEPSPQNLAYSPKPMTIFTRKVGGIDCEWHAFFNDNDLVTPDIVAHAAARLRFLPPTLNYKFRGVVP